MLEVGKRYETVCKGEFLCIDIRGNYAYMIGSEGQTAYVWDADTGKSKCLAEAWDVTKSPAQLMYEALKSGAGVEAAMKAYEATL